MPNVDFRVIVLQDCADVTGVQSAIDAYLGEGASALSHAAMALDDVDFGSFNVALAMNVYSILEAATSIKPAVARHFVRNGYRRVTYLDPDIEVFKDFSPLLNDEYDVTYTPHFLTDLPDDDYMPSQGNILSSGFYNLGFFSVAAGAEQFLSWWADRLQIDGVADPANGSFADQKIAELAPMHANLQVLREPGCNVAYWNLHERTVRDGETPSVTFDGVTTDLYFYHYSGFLLSSPSLSKHASRPHVGVAVSRSFLKRYDDQLRELPTGAQAPWEYPFELGGLPLALPTADYWRASFNQQVRVHRRAGLSYDEIEAAYLDASPVPPCVSCQSEHRGVGRRASAVFFGWLSYPHLNGLPNGLHFQPSAPGSRVGSEVLVRPTMRLLRAAPDADHLSRAIERLDAAVQQQLAHVSPFILVGNYTYAAGVGEIARTTLEIADNAGLRPGVEVLASIREEDAYRSALLLRRSVLTARDALKFYVSTAEQMDKLIRHDRTLRRRSIRLEAVWAWETEDIPRWWKSFVRTRRIKKIFALSNWSAAPMSRALGRHVERFAPIPMVEVERTVPSAQPYVLLIFDAKSIVERKNPGAVLSTWNEVARAFPDHRLVIKSMAFYDHADPALVEMVANSPRTEVLDAPLPEDVLHDLYAGAAAYVTLHRSEGLGLTPIEAALRGVPVVYTNYGGVVEFLRETHFPVDWSTTSIGTSTSSFSPYNPQAHWAEPDLRSAVEQLTAALRTRRDAPEVAVWRDVVAQRVQVAHREIAAHLRAAASRAELHQHRTRMRRYTRRLVRTVLVYVKKSLGLLRRTLPTPLERAIAKLVRVVAQSLLKTFQ